MFGTGTATCAATRRCVDACGLSSAPPPDLGLAGEPATIEACWQRCVVASCPWASAPLLALTACLETHSDAECQAEASACEASACTP